jgi:hypothetical protein
MACLSQPEYWISGSPLNRTRNYTVKHTCFRRIQRPPPAAGPGRAGPGEHGDRSYEAHQHASDTVTITVSDSGQLGSDRLLFSRFHIAWVAASYCDELSRKLMRTGGGIRPTPALQRTRLLMCT